MHKRIIIILVSVVMFMEFLDTTIINTAIPTIAKNFNQDPLLLKFSVTSYFLGLAIFTPISGWVADKFGTKLVFLLSVSVFVIASFFCGLSTNIPELTSFRFLQGTGGAFMNPVSRIIILRIFQPKDLVRVQGYIFTPAMLGFVLGPFLGGIITTYLHWSWIFFVNIPIGLIVIYFALRFIVQQKSTIIKKFDLTGFILSAFSLGSISFSADMFGHYEIVPKFVVLLTGFLGVSLFIVLLFHCARNKNPVFNFFLFKIKTFRIGLSANFTMYMLVSSVSFLLPLMYQVQFSYSPAYAGILLLPIAVAQLIFRYFAPLVIHNLGFKVSMLTACLLAIFMFFLLATIQVNSSIYFIIFVEFLLGTSFIIFGSSTGALNYIDIPKEQSASATALDLTSRQFASSLGIAFSVMFVNFYKSFFSMEITSNGGVKIFHYTFLSFILLVFLSILQVMQLKRYEGNHALEK